MNTSRRSRPGTLRLRPYARLTSRFGNSCHALLIEGHAVYLNEAAARVLQMCDGSATRREVINQIRMQCREGCDPSDIEAFIDAACERKWIVEERHAPG